MKPLPCRLSVCGPSLGCAVLALGIAACTGANADADAGNPGTDAGNTVTDAGNTVTDAGNTVTDAGNTVTDAGNTDVDGGGPAHDAGNAGVDAGTPMMGERFVVEPETTADFYVGSTGSDSNAGNSEGQAFATIAHALEVSLPGAEIMVVDEITESIENTHIRNNGGTASAYKVVKGKTVNTIVNGTLVHSDDSMARDAHVLFKNLWFKASTQEESATTGLLHAQFFRCMFSGGGLSGNVTKLAVGSEQVFEQCGFFGPGGRYNVLVYQQANVVLRHCVGRVDSGWGDASEPDGNIQVYSSNNVSVIQSVAFDWQARTPSYEHLGEFLNTTNRGGSENVNFYNCYAVGAAGAPGFQGEGSEPVGMTLTDCVATDNQGGVVENGQNGGYLTVSGGQFENNTGDGLASYGNATATVVNLPNVAGNTGEQVRNFSGAFTSNAPVTRNRKMLGGLLSPLGAADALTEQQQDLFTSGNAFISADVQAMFRSAMETVRPWSQQNLGDVLGVSP